MDARTRHSEDEDDGEDDGETALRSGRELLADGDRDAAEGRFEEAFGLGAAGAPWRIAHVYLDAGDARTAAWMRRAAASLSRPGGITVDADTLPITTGRVEDFEYPEGQVWCVAVTDCDPLAAATALRAAEPALGQATEDGRVPSAEEIASAPYYANRVWIDEAALTVGLDAKDAAMPMLARVVLTVLVEELRRAGVTRARLYTPAGARPRP
ncbi:hypothetical protein [Streptacidiphilus sp. P02-A3a]|uniref:hypothetical protein n=1 Tax=Streptacidiphilus sp. P02-A3a TaxID=2704468 RepID=UPI0015FD3952|nr:hypothetical protein [Streptacidiphilus sp. P02-A3a]QMU66988.1 hypothetical protein GXP74_00935 [Streptacidiphilus sp. P02-A3a]